MGAETTVEFTRRCRHCGSELSATSSFCSKCGATAEAVGAGGDPIRDRVRTLFGTDLDIERELGRGGMAVVFAGFDPALQRRVAVKVLLPEIANDRSMADRFLREARTVASLQHPHVVTVYSVRSQDGVHAIVMQFVEGRSLDAVLREQERIPVHVAGMLLAQSAEGLQHAHDRGVIHRDVKPANVLIDRDGRAVVSDFGIARRDHGPRTTETGLVIGTWAYMSPEQRTADAISPATDQYALGVMAFELLTGRLPFNGSPAEMMTAHMHAPPPSLSAIRSDVPPSVEAVVHRMLAKQASDRFPSLKDAERAFRSLVPDEGKTTLQLAAFSQVRTRAGSQVVAAVARSVPAADRSAPTVRTVDESRGRSSADVPIEGIAAPGGGRIRILGGAAAGLAILALGYVLTRGTGSTLSDPPSAVPQTELAGGSGGAAGNAAGGDVGPGGRLPGESGAGARAPSQGDAGGTDVAGRQAPPRAGGAGVPASGEADVPARVAGGALAPAPLVSTRDSASRVAVPNAPAAPVTLPSADTALPRVASAPERAAPAPSMPAATVADARRIAREFVTLLNQRRFRELAQLDQVGGDDESRAELLRLTESAPDFAAGFDRVAAAPAVWARGFETVVYLDLQWRGGARVMRVRLYCAPADGGWTLVGLAAYPAG